MFRKIFTLLCGFIYRHPKLYALADAICFRNAPEWRKISGDFILPGAKVLEVGCGRYPAIKEGLIADSSLPLLENAPDRFVRVCTSATELPFRAGTFDCVLTVFPPGIAADEGFFREKRFWEELYRVLTDNGRFIALIYIKYDNFLSRLSSKTLDPLLDVFWINLRVMAGNFEIIEKREKDSKGNTLVFVIARKKN